LLAVPATHAEPSLRLETRFARLGFARIAGVDEAGRGPLAGPVVASAVLIGDPRALSGVRDSKALSPLERERLFAVILREARAVGVGIASRAVIDRLDILRATRLAMARAVARLRPAADLALVDGRDAVPGRVPSFPVVRGDRLSLSIAAASIVAKVTRDLIMARFDRIYPGYGFSTHQGYPTAAHRAAIRHLGPSPIHRRSFRLLG
jgi:ribonuclease HII